MKNKYGLPPEDGYISCKICGEYLCDEDTTLFDGYDGDKPMTTREVIEKDKDKDLEISDYLSEREEIVKIIKLIGDSLGVPLEDNDNYVFDVELPGFSKTDIKINIKDNNLILKAKNDKRRDIFLHLKKSTQNPREAQKRSRKRGFHGRKRLGCS